MPIYNNILLIGMPAAGKSTIGVVLAKTLGMMFIDTDLLIQKKEERVLQDIINQDGIDRFLEIEEEVLLSLNCDRTVIATGGSAVYSAKAIEYLKKNSVSIYFMIEFKEIEKRISNISTRGIVLGKGQSLRDIYNARVPLYERYADITINCNNKSIEEIVDTIIRKLKIK